MAASFKTLVFSISLWALSASLWAVETCRFGLVRLSGADIAGSWEDFSDYLSRWVSQFPVAQQTRMTFVAKQALLDLQHASLHLPWAAQLPHLDPEQNPEKAYEARDRWLEQSADAAAKTQRLELQEARSVSKVTHAVYEAKTQDGKTVYVRPIDYQNAHRTRREFAAYQINQKLELQLVPPAEVHSVQLTYPHGPAQNLMALVSRAAPGIEIKKNQNPRDYTNAIQHSNAMLLEFLLSNRDAQPLNYRITTEGSPQFFDHDLAFLDLLSKGYPEFQFGYDLPHRYVPTTLNLLSNWTPEQIRQELHPYLSEIEVEYLIFRRFIILEDAKLRGESALFSQ